MKKVLPIVLIGVVLIAFGVFLAVNSKSTQKNSSDNHSHEHGDHEHDHDTFSAPKACDVFTLDDAKKVLGDTAQKPEETQPAEASSNDIDVSQCIYQQPADTIAAIKTQKQASLLVRGAKTKTGAESNKDYFNGTTKPQGVQEVSGYGDTAFWNPQFGQLNILKGNNWYILQVGVSTPGNRTVDEAKTLADALIAKL